MSEEWPEPWFSIDEAERRAFEQELRKELSAAHPLASLPLTVVARRDDQDDVLVRLGGEANGKVAQVHLTWRGSTEPDPRWPATVIFESMEDWRRQLDCEGIPLTSAPPALICDLAVFH